MDLAKTEPDSVFVTDNGRLLCGADLGASARFTGRDISGQRIERVSPEYAAAYNRDLADIGVVCCCEACGKVARIIHVVC